MISEPTTKTFPAKEEWSLVSGKLQVNTDRTEKDNDDEDNDVVSPSRFSPLLVFSKRMMNQSRSMKRI